MSTGPTPQRPLSWSGLKGVDQACERFEAAWKAVLAGQAAAPPRLEEYLAQAAEPELSHRLLELLRLEREYRNRLGQATTLQEYQARFPSHASVVRAALTEPWGTVTFRPPETEVSPEQIEVVLTVVEGPDRGDRAEFSKPGRFIVGRGQTADFRIRQDQTVGRMHFLIEIEPPACRLHDMASRNGVEVNGKRVLSVDLHEGDLIHFGETSLRVTLRTVKAVAAPGSTAPVAADADDLYATRAPSVPPEPMAATGQRQGPLLEAYEIVSELGHGGMGVVYKGRRKVDGGLVAIKTIRPGQAGSAAAVDRFLREASILRNLTHPNIVGFLDLGMAGDEFFFVMEFVPGSDLGKLATEASQPLEVPRAVTLICHVLDALAYAHGHARRFVHRDVKPRNVLVTRADDGREIAKLTDFGLARLYQTSRLGGQVLVGGTGGTLGFMAPEQLSAFHQAGEPADQYGAAATLYHLLTGALPYNFSDDVSERFAMLREKEHIPIQQRRPDLPADLAAIVERAMSRDPGARFPSVKALREALARFGV
jgi:serine/threonine-protein kinase